MALVCVQPTYLPSPLSLFRHHHLHPLSPVLRSPATACRLDVVRRVDSSHRLWSSFTRPSSAAATCPLACAPTAPAMGRVVRGPVARRARAAALAASPRPGPGEAIMVVVAAPGAGLYALAPVGGGGGGVPDADAVGAAVAVAGGVGASSSPTSPPPSSASPRAPSPPELYRLPRRLVGVVYTRPSRHVIARRYAGGDDGGGGKVAGEVVAALLDDHVDDLRRVRLWPTDAPGRGGGRGGATGAASSAAVTAAAAAHGEVAGARAALKRAAVDAGWGFPSSDSASEGCGTMP